jgi:two-component system heavy metal sensor histidine kinase CusS
MLRRLSLSRLSLTRRLTLFFTLVAASIVLGLGGLFMTAADRHFIDLDRSVLQDKQHLIDDILTSANSAEDLRWRLSEALNHHHGLFVRVTTPTGQALFQTEGFPAPDRWLLPEHETLLHALTGAARTAAIPHPAVPCPGTVCVRGPTVDHLGHGYDSPPAFSG